MNKEIDKQTDWLSKFHEGQKFQRNATYALLDTQAMIYYTFPHISDDLKIIIEMLDKSEKLISEAMNQNMSESLKSSQDFIDLALVGMLRAAEKKSEN